MDKRFKEGMRMLKIDPKLRNYLNNNIDVYQEVIKLLS